MKNDGKGKKDLLSVLGVTVNKEMILALFWCNDVRQCMYMYGNDEKCSDLCMP